VHDPSAKIQTRMLPLKVPVQESVCASDAVACSPKHNDVFVDVRSIDFNRWLTKANNIGSTSRMVK